MPKAPKTLQQKILDGTKPSRMNTAEPKNKSIDDLTSMTPPSYLPKGAKAEWRRVMDSVDANLLTHADLSVLIQYCIAHDLYVDAVKNLAKQGAVHTTPNGHTQPSTWSSLVSRYGNDLLKLERELGFTPASRTKVQIPNNQPSDLKAFLESRGRTYKREPVSGATAKPKAKRAPVKKTAKKTPRKRTTTKTPPNKGDA